MEKSFSELSCQSRVDTKSKLAAKIITTTNHDSGLDRESTFGIDSHDIPVS